MLLAAWLLASTPTTACTTFCLEAGERVLFGRNYDWSVGAGMLVSNKRNVAKTAMAADHLAVGKAGSMDQAFVDYSLERNLTLIRKAFAGTEFLRQTPLETMSRLARYPDSLACSPTSTASPVAAER